MAFLIRRCLVNARNIEKCRKLCVSVQSDKYHSKYHRTKQYSKADSDVPRRNFYTSKIHNKTVSFKLSDIGEGIREVVVKEWFVKVGDKVEQFDNICEVQSDKAAVTITSRYDGVITKIYHEVDQTALVGQPLIDIQVPDGEEDASNDSDVTEENEETNPEIATQKAKVLTVPSVRRIAAQYKVDLSKVPATGRNGRILKEDVLNYLNISSEKSNEIPDSTVVQARVIPVVSAVSAHVKTEVILEDKVVPVTGFTKAMVKSMTEAMKIPHFGFSEEYDVTKLVESRKVLKQLAEEQGVKFSYMPLIIKAASLSLTAYPILNSSLDTKCENVIYKANHNIGVAMDTPNGLIVPVIKNVQNKSILDIARELNTLQDKGAKGQLGISDIIGGTFTLSNIGIVGGTYAKPIILPPQVSIGALGKIQVLPRFDAADNVVKAHILKVSWSADHRVIDGVTMARFSNRLKRYLEEPYTFILDL